MTPRSAAAAEAGARLLAEHLGRLAVSRVDRFPGLHDRLESDEGARRRFGQLLAAHIDFEELPSRLEIRREYDGPLDELSFAEAGDRRLERGLETVPDHEIFAAAARAVVDA